MPVPCTFFLLDKIISSETRSNHAVFTQKGVQQPVETVADSGRGRVRRTPPPLLGHLPAIRAKAHILICVKFEGKLSVNVGIYLLRPLLRGGKAPHLP